MKKCYLHTIKDSIVIGHLLLGRPNILQVFSPHQASSDIMPWYSTWMKNTVVLFGLSWLVANEARLASSSIMHHVSPHLEHKGQPVLAMKAEARWSRTSNKVSYHTLNSKALFQSDKLCNTYFNEIGSHGSMDTRSRNAQLSCIPCVGLSNQNSRN